MAEETALNLALLEPPKTGFVALRPISKWSIIQYKGLPVKIISCAEYVKFVIANLSGSCCVSSASLLHLIWVIVVC